MQHTSGGVSNSTHSFQVRTYAPMKPSGNSIYSHVFLQSPKVYNMKLYEAI